MLGWLRNKCPIDAGTKQWVEDRFGWLLARFGRERFERTQTITPEQQVFPDGYDNSEEAARKLFDKTCQFMGVDRSTIELIFHQPEHRPGLSRALIRRRPDWAGLYHRDEDERSVVVIDALLLPLPETLLATFAHELAHELLKGTQVADEHDHELVTDLTCAFFGMGIFNANDSYESQFRIDLQGNEIGQLGYLTPHMWSYSLALRTWLLVEADVGWSNWLRPHIRKMFRRFHKYLLRTADAKICDGQLNSSERIELLRHEFPDYFLREITEPDDDHYGGAEPNNNGQVEFNENGEESAYLLIEAHHLMEAEEFEAALECLDEAIQLDSDNGEAFQQRAMAKIELGLVADAIEDANHAVLREPDDPESYFVRGAARVKAEEFQKAIDDLTRFLKTCDDSYGYDLNKSRALWLRGLAKAGLDSPVEAIKDYDSSIREYRDWPEPFEARAKAHAALGQLELARADELEAQRRANQ